ncbi:MAG: hypothetical protein RI897_2095 [Verrucomicrobiota bacterium]|jgi:DNA-binding beta-propeller fold protein YncE
MLYNRNELILCLTTLDIEKLTMRVVSFKRAGSTLRVVGFLLLAVVCGGLAEGVAPVAMVASGDGSRVYVGGAGEAVVLEVVLAEGRVVGRWEVAGRVSGLAWRVEDRELVVTLAAVDGGLEVLDVEGGGRRVHPVGHMVMAPVVVRGGGSAWLARRFRNEVVEVDLGSGEVLRVVGVEREPVAMAMTGDGRWLLVANLLHNGRSDGVEVAAGVSVVDAVEGRVVKTLRLPNGSGYLNAVEISPDGRWAVVTHLVSRFPLPTTQVERGWMNTNAMTLIDLETMTVLNTVLLDTVDRGAANPWGVAWSGDGGALVVAHAGTHELSVVDVGGLVAKLEALPEEMPEGGVNDYRTVSRCRRDVPNDLAFLVGLRGRVALGERGLGPRSVVVADGRVVSANYFSDTLSVVGLGKLGGGVRTVELGERGVMSEERLGELYFHDARLCFQGWQSCASCHPGEGRMDALNWDLLNDGIGNPKNNRSLLYSHRMGPAMSLGVRPTAEEAVRAGIRHILFTVQPEGVAEAMDAYLKSLRPVPSPYLEGGELSAEARRGRELFESAGVGCGVCHPGELYSDLGAHDVGTRGELDGEGDVFFTPTLVEVWRTGPYLHDGSAATLVEVLTERNLGDAHGVTSGLSESELTDLVAYLLSL